MGNDKKVKLWIDDQRDPENYLNKKQLENVVWIKKIREALFVVLDDEVDPNAEEIFLDHYMDEEHLTGLTLLNDLYWSLKSKCIVRESLKKIHLHSSEGSIVKKALNDYQEKYKELGIDLVKANYTRGH